jgi:hypothetical protein
MVRCAGSKNTISKDRNALDPLFPAELNASLPAFALGFRSSPDAGLAASDGRVCDHGAHGRGGMNAADLLREPHFPEAASG